MHSISALVDENRDRCVCCRVGNGPGHLLHDERITDDEPEDPRPLSASSETTGCLCSLLNTNFLVATKRLTSGEESTGTRWQHLLLPIQCNNALRT